MPERVFANKYEVQQEIAQGAMGIVYKALDQKLNRLVALKVVHPHLTSDASFLQRFLREARAMARLQHEHIVTIYSVEQDQGTQFMVMEYFPGTNLHGRMQPNLGLPLNQAISFTYQIAKALAYAHAHGIIHRDIKPANVLIGADDRVKLTDFGIAAALDEAPLTTAGQLIGTLLYMSPEQARDAGLDGRSDLYALGLMFYEMLTGTHPRRGLSNAAILGMLANEDAAPTLTFTTSIPPDVQVIVKDLLRYRPVDRIGDAHQLVHRLESLQTGGRPVPRSTPQLNAIVDDRTICELPEPPASGSPVTEKAPQLPAGKQPGTTTWRRIAAIGIATMVALALGILGINSSLFTKQGQGYGSVDPVPLPPPPDSQVLQLLTQLKQSVANKDLGTIDRISVMSEDRRSWLEGFFRNYSTIEASLGDIGNTSDEITAVLRIDKLILPSGEAFPVGPSLQKIRLTVPRERNGWGKINW